MRSWGQDTIEKADPQIVPFYQWFLREMYELLGSLVTGFFAAIVFIISMRIMIGVLTTLYPQFTFQLFQHAVCAGH